MTLNRSFENFFVAFLETIKKVFYLQMLEQLKMIFKEQIYDDTIKKGNVYMYAIGLNKQFQDRFVNLFIMTTLYFAASKSGYTQRLVQGAPKSVSGRQIPVYKRVNQFMNLPQREDDKSIIKEVDQEAEHFQPQKSTRSLDTAMQKGVKCKLVKSAHMIQKIQGESLYGDQMDVSFIKQREYSSKDTSASQIDLINRKKINVNIIESQIGKNQEYEQIFDRVELERQIEKEKTLRKNLEHSYFSLLDKLKLNMECRSTDFNDPNGNQRNRKSKQPSRLHHDDFIQQPTKKLRKSCFEPKRMDYQPSQKSRKSNKSQNLIKSCSDREEADISENIYQRQLHRQQRFQSNLLSQIESTNARIDQLQNNLIKRQMQIQKLLRQRDERSIFTQKTNQSYSISKSQQKKQSQFGLKHQIHYIFTIFVMFLIVAMISKNKQK